MSRLSAGDVKAVLELVGEANDSESVEEFRAFLLPALRRIVPADFASYNEILDGGRVLAAIVQPELPAEMVRTWAQFASENPLVARSARTRDGRPYRFSDVLSEAELRALPVYTEFFSRIGVHHQIAFALPAPPALVRGIALARTRRDFSDREREMLDLARPYLVQAYRNAALRERLAVAAEGLAGALDHLDCPALIADRMHTVLYATERAAAILELLGGAPGRPLPPELSSLTSPEGPPVLLALPTGPIVARVVRGPRRGERVIVLEDSRPPSVQELAGLGLTRRETAVLSGFADGQTPAQVAARLGISVRTVHKHTQHIHAKLGTRDRAQAVATACAALRTSA